MEEQASEYQSRTRAMGGIAVGLIIAEIGVLHFVKTQFGVEWPQMWPLLLLVPGLAIAIGALSGNRHRRH